MRNQSTSSESFPPKPRKFYIQSQFGHPRTPRSRKNRPCDACRRRKTACIIPDKPPCLSCKSRGFDCISSSGAGPTASSPHPGSDASASDSQPLFSVNQASSTPVLPISRILNQNLDPGSASVTADGLLAPTQGISPRDPAAVPATYTLEDIPTKTAHCMGPTAEQDTYLLDAFRSVIMSEEEVDADIIQVYSGDRGSNEDPVHFLLLQDEFPEHTNRAMEAASHGIESTVWPYGPDLVRLFFRHIHPVYPIVSKVRFLRQYIRAKEEIPTSLRGAIYALACVFWNCDPSLRNRRSFVQHELLDHAHSALRRELESPSLFKLQACLLLLHLRPPEIDSVETPSTWILTSQAVACAQMMGLHRDPRPWNIVSSEKKLRKKLWWATYVTDCWSSISHGNPPHISADSFDTSPLDMEDVRFDEDVPDDLSSLVDSSDTSFRVVDGARFMKTVEIAQCLRTVLDCSFQIKPTRDPTIPSPKAQLIRARHTLVDWLNLLPQALGVGSAGGPLNLHNNIPLHLSYYAAQVLLFRALMHPATKEARVDPESNLRQWFSAALDEFKSFTTFMDSLCGDDLGCFWPRHTRSQLILCGNFLIYMFLLAYTPHDIEAAYRLLESFQQSLQRLETAESIDGRLVLRPVTLRINSFFAQASDLLKGASSSSTSIGVNVNTPMTPM